VLRAKGRHRPHCAQSDAIWRGLRTGVQFTHLLYLAAVGDTHNDAPGLPLMNFMEDSVIALPQSILVHPGQLLTATTP
jgi:hypothetical protein